MVVSTPLSRLFSAGSSAQSAESAPLRPSWFSALNLCEFVRDGKRLHRELRQPYGDVGDRRQTG